MEHTPFMKIKDAARVTGLSQYYLRNGCKDGSVPHVKSGTVYLVNVPRLLEKLDALEQGGKENV
ncbi:hypothetical protein D7X94_17460 [Acutalibacter sp. 1XD8-33]|uniref:hypothetical protein n=1 Tax=Acutalibacter sp. 1XD8-33 TaxID=2320081 RepID=UPI000EA3AAFE|nr:hypothetical protein [Acutalibacter sp. 1XD8-33]RKJ38162.1 hypothetical protein D7X94_17460 [Acutalibacter sp. 1XD8-33]